MKRKLFTPTVLKVTSWLFAFVFASNAYAGVVTFRWDTSIREYGNWTISGYYDAAFVPFRSRIDVNVTVDEISVRPNFSNSTITRFGGVDSTKISTPLLHIFPNYNDGAWSPDFMDTFVHVSDEAEGSFYAEFGSRMNDDGFFKTGQLSDTFFVVQRGYISTQLAQQLRDPLSAGLGLYNLASNSDFFSTAQVTSSWIWRSNGASLKERATTAAHIWSRSKVLPFQSLIHLF